MHPVAFDLDRAYRLSPAATLRPEPFGALAYHFMPAVGIPAKLCDSSPLAVTS
jgi:hypothetical protein